jgi:uncharacterized Zn finger protein (UPF0148 family)
MYLLPVFGGDRLSLTCLKCGMELKQLNGTPCPKCGTPAYKGRSVYMAATVRKVVKEQTFKAQTVRTIIRLRRQYYKTYPKCQWPIESGHFWPRKVRHIN